MAGRKAQHDAEYFPFYAKEGRTLFMLQTRFGLEGIGFFTNLMRLFCTTDHHYLNLSDPVQAAYTWSKLGVNDDDKAEKMIALMVITGKLDRGLWENFRVLYSPDFVASLSELYAKRKETPLTIDQIRGMYSIVNPEKTISAPDLPRQSPEIPISGVNNTQSRVEESRKEKRTPIVPLKSTETNSEDFEPDTRPSAEDFNPDTPIRHTHPTSEVNAFFAKWNACGLPEYRKLLINVPNAGELMESLSFYTAEEINSAIEPPFSPTSVLLHVQEQHNSYRLI